MPIYIQENENRDNADLKHDCPTSTVVHFGTGDIQIQRATRRSNVEDEILLMEMEPVLPVGTETAMSETNKIIHEWLYPAAKEPPRPFDGTPDTLPASFGEIGPPAYDTDPGACLRLIEAVRAKRYDIGINLTLEGVVDVAFWRASSCIAGHQGYEGKLPPVVAQAVVNLIEAESPVASDQEAK